MPINKMIANRGKLFQGLLNAVEKIGNALPHPATLFDWYAVHPATSEEIYPVNLLSVEGIHRILTEMVTNFTSFAPLGIVMVAMLGIGIAESSGLIGAFIRLIVLSFPKKLLTFVLVLTGILSNMAMGSESAKWAIMAPVFIPMFMLLGYSPELSQAVYRIGDSITNVISPMMSFFALIIAFVQKYDKKAGIGTIIAIMLPYTIAFFIVWTLLLIGWLLLGLDLGPGAGIYYDLQG